MRRALVVLIAVAAQAAVAAPGRVVRIERPRATAVPHFCGMFGTDVICVGPAPAIDERIALIDTRSNLVLGELRVETVADSTEFQMCPKSMYKVTGSPIGFTAPGNGAAGSIFGVRGIRVDAHARVVRNPQPPRDNVSVELALDLDEDGATDVMITQYACDAAGNPSTFTPSGRARICFDSYLRRGHQLERVAQDVLQQCL